MLNETIRMNALETLPCYAHTKHRTRHVFNKNNACMCMCIWLRHVEKVSERLNVRTNNWMLSVKRISQRVFCFCSLWHCNALFILHMQHAWRKINQMSVLNKTVTNNKPRFFRKWTVSTKWNFLNEIDSFLGQWNIFILMEFMYEMSAFVL